MIIFENRGEADILALVTFGVSVKEGDNPIGMFGTGFKYALAVILRDGGSVSAFIGEEEHQFGVEKVEVRGRQISFVTVIRVGIEEVSTRLGFTTDLGKNWLPWMAYRELYCNARDEGGEVYTVATGDQATDPRPSLTQIRVKSAALETVHADAADYFLEDTPDWTVGDVEVRRRPSRVLYYRGIRVMELPKPSLFTYNLLGRIDLTEDRTIANPYMAAYYLSRAIGKSDDPALLETALTATQSAFESGLDYHSYGETPSPTFLATVSRLSSGTGHVVESARTVWRVRQPVEFSPKIATVTGAHILTWNRASKLFEKILNETVAPRTLTVVEDLDDGTLVTTTDGVTYVSLAALDPDNAAPLAGALLKEYANQVLGYEDASRQMQNWLLERLVDAGEALLGSPETAP